MANLRGILFTLWFVSSCYSATRLRRENDRSDIYYIQDHDFDHQYIQQNRSSNVFSELSTSSSSREIPLELLMRLSSVENLDDFINNFVDQNSILNNTQDQSGILSNRFGADDERKSAQIPKPAACIPELKIVPLHSSNNPALFYYPTCTRVERCGGCCASALLSCQPTQTEVVNFQVLVTEFKGAKQMKYKATEIIPVERHTQCKCDCTIKAMDCNQFQEYRKNECRCVCLNVDEQQKCLQENDIKLWDYNSCICQCRETKDCTTGFYFDQITCRCVQERRAGFSLQARRRRGQKTQRKETRD